MIHSTRKYTRIIILPIIVLFVIFGILKLSANDASSASLFNEETLFEKNLGDIYIPSDLKYMLNFYFKTDANKKTITDSNDAKDLNISFNIPGIKIVDYAVTLMDLKTGLCELTLYLNLDKDIDYNLERIEINMQQYDIGSIRIHSWDNNDFDVVSSYALGKEFTGYNSTIESSSNDPIAIVNASCGKFQNAVKSCTWIINGAACDSEAVKKMTIGTGDIIELSIELDKDAVSDEYKVILLSPKIEYNSAGEAKEYFLPYCIYNRLL